MRAFIALDLPEEFAGELADLARQLSPAVRGRYLPRGNYHVTLAFLGEVGEVAARDAVAALDAACAGAGPVALRPAGLGHFGRPRDATLWLGLEPVAELTELAAAVRDELSAAGLAHDAKEFRPHITIARRVQLPRGPLPGLVFPQAAEARAATLYKSVLGSDGATYKPLYTVELE